MHHGLGKQPTRKASGCEELVWWVAEIPQPQRLLSTQWWTPGYQRVSMIHHYWDYQVACFYIFLFLTKLFKCFFLVAWQHPSCSTQDLSCGVQALCSSVRGPLYPCCVGSRVRGLGRCGTWGLAVPGIGDLSSPTKDQTCAPSVGSQILHHWTTREAHWISY